MSDTTKETSDRDVENREEPETVDLAEAAAKEATKHERETPRPNPEDFTPEQMRKLEEMFKQREESASSRAVNQYREKIEKSGDYVPADEFDKRVGEAIEKERERMTLEMKARESFNENLGRLGISAGSDEYKKVAKVYAELEEQGAITPRALLSEAGVKALAFSAGVIDSEAAQGPQRGFDTSYRLELNPRTGEDDRPMTTDDRLWVSVNKALGKS